MDFRVGRPLTRDNSKVIKCILNHKEEIVLDDNKIVTKNNPIWKSIEYELNGCINAKSLYTFVTANRYNVRSLLTDGKWKKLHKEVRSVNEDLLMETSEENRLLFSINVSNAIFQNLLVTRSYKSCNNFKTRLILKPGEWQEFLTRLIWEETKLKCGFNFKNHYVSANWNGYINGECKCGSELQCIFNKRMDSNISFNFEIKKGINICGKRYLRNPTRADIGEVLTRTSVELFRSQQAKLLMEEDEPEAPHLYSKNVLHTAKKEYINSQHVHSDVIISLNNMQKNNPCLINLGLDPFFVHYVTNAQISIYKKLSKKYHTPLFVDATGGIVRKILKPNTNKSGHIFLYIIVLNTNKQQMSIAQMLSEKQDTNKIAFWLLEWVRMGAPYPKEIVCDRSRALLNGICKAFSLSSTVRKYSDGFFNTTVLPDCYIRIDVAHFMKNYSIFLGNLQNLSRRVRIFYMAVIGNLVVCKNLLDAERIVENIFIVSCSEFTGKLPDGRNSLCHERKEELRNMITGEIDGCNDLDNFNKEQKDIFEKEIDENDIKMDSKWQRWARLIYDKIINNLNIQMGDEDNAHYLPILAEHLIKDMELFPLWSSVFRDAYGYGRVPASSASVESEFNKIKNQIFKGSLPLRADDFVHQHLDYLQGRTLIANASTITKLPIKKKYEVVPEDKKDIDNLERQHLEEELKVSVNKNENLETQECQEEESWRGLSGKYLGKNTTKIKDALTFEKHSKVPILRNGNCFSMERINVNGKMISFTNTCPFDSFFQILLASCVDSEKLFNSVKTLIKDSPLYSMIVDTIVKGINKNTYIQRANILFSIFGKLINNSLIINCNTNAGWMAGQLVSNTPSMLEFSKCQNGCTPRTKKLAVLQIDSKDILTDFENIFENSIFLKHQTKCIQKGCSGYEDTSTQLGNLIIFDICETIYIQEKVQLNNLKKEINNPYNGNKKLRLCGVVEYSHPCGTKSQSMGHYTAIAHRKSGTWVQYDDLTKKSKILKSTYFLICSVLLYKMEE